MPKPEQQKLSVEKLKPGQLVAGYSIVKKIGEGAMAILYLVTDKDGHQYSLKMPLQRFGVDPVSLIAFENELRLAPYLEDFPHAHMPKVIHDGENKYLRMEYIEGVDLWGHLTRNGCLNEDEAISLIKKVVYALAKLHERRIVHLDIKLSNIMVTTEGEVRLIDFGLASHMDLPDIIHESFYEPKGTPCYIAPEQFIGIRDDIRSDIFSLGVMLFEMTTNKLPYSESNTTLDVISRIKKGFDLPKKYKPDLSETFNYVVGTCLQTNPDIRFTDMWHLYEVLGMWEGDIPIDTIIGLNKNNSKKNKQKETVTKLLKPAYHVLRNMFDFAPNDFQCLKQWAEYRRKNQEEIPYRILVAIMLDDKMQLSPFAMEILEEGYHLARLEKTAITIVSALEGEGAGMASGENEAQMNNELCNKARVAISNLVHASEKSDIAVGINVQAGSPVEVIENCIDYYNADLLVMGSRKKSGFRKYMQNSNGNKIISAIKCNTYIVHEGKGIINKKSI